MKRLVLFLGITVLAFVFTWALKAQQTIRQEKEVVLRLTKDEVEALYTIIDDAAVPGQVRKPLLQKIATAYNSAFQVQSVSQPKDTTKTKKN